MEYPTAPSWFKKELAKLSPTLRVEFVGPAQRWQIFQLRKRVKQFGRWNGHVIRGIVTYKAKVLNASELGSRILDDLRRCDNQRYRRYEDFCKEFNIHYE